MMCISASELLDWSVCKRRCYFYNWAGRGVYKRLSQDLPGCFLQPQVTLQQRQVSHKRLEDKVTDSDWKSAAVTELVMSVFAYVTLWVSQWSS